VRPRQGASAISVLYPADGIGPVAAFEALHLAFTQLQQTGGGFVYAQPPPAAEVLDVVLPADDGPFEEFHRLRVAIHFLETSAKQF